jgi:hypothetical protein
MVDIHRDSGLTDHSRLDALKARGVEVREVTVVAEAKRHRFRRRADDGIGSEIVMRRRDREHSASCGAPIMQDCIETSAKSEVVTVCSRQSAGEETLQSTAMILITTGEPRRYDGHWRR